MPRHCDASVLGVTWVFTVALGGRKRAHGANTALGKVPLGSHEGNDVRLVAFQSMLRTGFCERP